MVRKAQAQTNAATLKVRKNRRVVLHYRVLLPNGEVFDASPPDSPLEIVCGRGDTIQGLEKRLLGMVAGEEREFVIPPEEAYGAYDPSLRRHLSRDDLPEGIEPREGLAVPFRSKGTEVVGRIVGMNDDTIMADFNHPLAGQELRYQVRILRVEEVQPELSVG